MQQYVRAIVVLLAAVAPVSACTSAGPRGPDQFRGISVPVSWEVVDISQRVAPDQREIRWYYTVVLKETGGKTIQFEKVVSDAQGSGVQGAPHEASFPRRLDPNSQLRWNYEYYIYFGGTAAPSFGSSVPGGPAGVIMLHRFHGRDADGNTVIVNVRFPLDPSVGKRVETAKIADLPPAEVPGWKPGYEWAYRWESPSGAGTFVATISREETVDGIACYVATAGRREVYFRKVDLASYMETVTGVVEWRDVPPRMSYAWPLFVGKQWEQSYKEERPRDRQTEELVVTWRVESVEMITVPAGAFLTFKIVWRNKRTGAAPVEVGYSPEVKNFVRSRAYRSDGIWTRELTSFKLDTQLKAVAPTGMTTIPPSAVSMAAPREVIVPSVETPLWKRGHVWAFRWESPRGKGTFVWVVDREETMDGVEYYVVTSGPTELYWRKADLAFYMEKDRGEVEERNVPAFIRYAWPLALQKTWEQENRIERPRDRTTEELTTVCKVEAEETITVPAGSFRALKIVCYNKKTGSISSARWYSPEVRQVIREERHFAYGIRYRELTSFNLE